MKQKAKSHVRQKLRQDHAINRKNYYQEIINNVSNSNFHKLIDLTRKSVYNSDPCPRKINGELSFDLEEQIEAITKHYKGLCTPNVKTKENDEYMMQVLEDIQIIQENSGFINDNPITIEEMLSAINSLNRGKSSDEYDIKTEVLQNCVSPVAPILVDLFEKCRLQRQVPKVFKKGILTSIPKKGKDPHVLDNHRGITVTSIIGKVFEHIMLNRLKSELYKSQSSLQFGFTEGLSTLLAALIISEATIEAVEDKDSLLVCTLDARKAFDTVNHSSLLRKLYLNSAGKETVLLDFSLYQDMTTKIKWHGKFGSEFKVLQGTRQGSVLSQLLYKVYINDLL